MSSTIRILTKVIGKTVKNKEGIDIGSLVDMIDLTDGRLVYVVLVSNGFLGE